MLCCYGSMIGPSGTMLYTYVPDWALGYHVVYVCFRLGPRVPCCIRMFLIGPSGTMLYTYLPDWALYRYDAVTADVPRPRYPPDEHMRPTF